MWYLHFYNQNNFTDADFISTETTNIQNIADLSNVEHQKVLEAEGLQSGSAPYLSSTTKVTTVSSIVMTTSHTETQAKTTSAIPPITELITESYEYVTARVDKTLVKESER